jgi:SnoaL-like domain
MSRAFDTQQLRRALEQSQAEVLCNLYADDAKMVIVDRDRPPSAPLVIEGRDKISEFWRDVCSRDMSHKVDHMIAGDERVSFVEECRYPDGCRVMSAMTLKLRDGRIIDHLTVQAWDEVSCAPA